MAANATVPKGNKPKKLFLKLALQTNDKSNKSTDCLT